MPPAPLCCSPVCGGSLWISSGAETRWWDGIAAGLSVALELRAALGNLPVDGGPCDAAQAGSLP